MIKIGITGNIAAGKSVVEKILRDFNYTVFDTDKVVHELFKTSAVLQSQLAYIFEGYDIFEENGFVSRSKLADVVFADKNMLRKLESAIHPLVIETIDKQIADLKFEQFVFISVPLLFEVGLINKFDKIILIYSDDEIRKQRLMLRRNMSEETALIRMNAQMPQSEKLKLADFVIVNNSNYADLLRQINETLSQLVD